MSNFPGSGIFWITLLSVAAILTLATLIGRAWGVLFPCHLRGPARFYLAPLLGLATLAIIASLIGRSLPLGNSVIVPALAISLLVWTLIREPRAARALHHAALVSVFGLACGASILGPLFAFGAFNAHNDTFTYLVHANWLQEHAFGDVISPASVTPLSTQVYIYQHGGFRMGASFLLALVQALLNLRWSYEIYPAAIISAIAVCCLSIGFPLAKSLQPIRRGTRLTLLALPAFTLGGLVFGANLGFLPQTVGLSLGAGFLFALGPLFQWMTTTRTSWRQTGKAAIPSVVLFAGAIFAYSELAPFLLVAALGSGFFLALRFRIWRSVLMYFGMLLVLACLLLNTELIRAYTALRTQSGAVVGSPVDWPLFGFVAHAFGVHGGAWDGFQWSSSASSNVILFVMGMALSIITGVMVLFGRRAIWRTTFSGVLMPAGMVLMIFCAGLLYFRYFVPSPFPKGLGQSWSQFKLSDWAHPFVMAFVLLAVAHLRQCIGKYFNNVVTSLFLMGLVCAALIGVARTTPLIQYYGNTQDLNRFYQEFRQSVLANCPRSVRVYLALNEQHHKFRQMAVYYLPDREVTSDWLDDGYIFSNLPLEHRTQVLNVGDCVVEPIARDGWLGKKAATTGPFRIGIYGGQGRVRIASATGAYDRENDGNNWWHWVERKVTFQLQPLFMPKEANQAKLHFEYNTRGKQTLTVRIRAQDGLNRQFSIPSLGDSLTVFEKMIDLPPSKLLEISIETDGTASPLGNGDPRITAWLIRNLTIGTNSLENAN